MAKKKTKPQGPRVLFLDIETAPILAHVWRVWQENVGLNQIEKDWSILSFAAKWRGDKKVIYHDVSKQKTYDNDHSLLQTLWKLLNEADIVVAHNGLKFDKKRINARFAMNGMPPPAPFKMIDTLAIAKKYFAFTSNRLEYLSDKLNKKYKKQSHEEFAGFALWSECLKGNKKAWAAMRKYNEYDVLALEELFEGLAAWADGDHMPNFSLYTEGTEHVCRCGSSDLQKRGFHFTAKGKFQRYQCTSCGAWTRDTNNLFDKDKRKSLHMGTPR
jgi:uncharacterized protein YprB with RNaseH-like and TPR domain